jgi:hypothetical protein
MARSLLDDSRYDSIGRGKSRSSGGASGDKVKLGLAIGLFVVAGAVLAWYYELIPGMGSTKPAPVVITQEQQEEIKKQEDHRQKQIERGEVTVGGD